MGRVLQNNMSHRPSGPWFPLVPSRLGLVNLVKIARNMYAL